MARLRRSATASTTPNIPERNYTALPRRVVIDCRWSMAYPVDRAKGGTSGADTVMSRTTYDTIDEAREHLARIRRYPDPTRV